MNKEQITEQIFENDQAASTVVDSINQGSDNLTSEDQHQLPVCEECNKLKYSLQQALEKANTNWKLYINSQADMDNLRKRTERDIQNIHKFALENLFKNLLPVHDCLEMGLSVAGNQVDIDKLKEGIELTLKQLVTVMEKFGIQEINPPITTKFDPSEHEAVSVVPIEHTPPNTIIQVIQKGYKLNERLIRSAKVIVAQLPST